MNPENTRIGFVGIGVMGKSMCRNMMKKGYKATIVSPLTASTTALPRSARNWPRRVLSSRTLPERSPNILTSFSRLSGRLKWIS